MKIAVKKIYDKEGKEAGAILRADTFPGISPLEKNTLEAGLVEYACTEIFNNIPVTLFVEKNVEVPCIIVLNESSNLEQSIIEIDDY